MTTQFIYAGIGSRETPADVQHYMKQLGKYLAINNALLRSGGADGADLAFESGCDDANGNKDIYIPWPRFNNSNSTLSNQTDMAMEIASKFHPAWNKLTVPVRKLMARNVHQVLGDDCGTPCHAIICYTKNGSGAGGTGQALRIAKHYGIPIFDFGKFIDSLNVPAKEAYFIILHDLNKIMP